MTDELKQTYAALQAENDRLRDVVKKAYIEGWCHAAIEHNRKDLDLMRDQAIKDWPASGACAALKGENNND